MTRLRDETAALHTAEMDYLGDEITYTPEGGSAQTFNAWVEFDNEDLRGSVSRSSARARLIEVKKSVIASPSKEGDRITIAVLPGETYKPADVLDGATGETWRIPLMRHRDV